MPVCFKAQEPHRVQRRIIRPTDFNVSTYSSVSYLRNLKSFAAASLQQYIEGLCAVVVGVLMFGQRSPDASLLLSMRGVKDTERVARLQPGSARKPLYNRPHRT